MFMFMLILYIIPKRSKDSLPRRRCWLHSKKGTSNKGRFGTAKSDAKAIRNFTPGTLTNVDVYQERQDVTIMEAVAKTIP